MDEKIQRKRLLITGGCSHSDSNYSAYKSRNIKVWPELVADKLNCDLINVAKKGMGNDYISGALMDAVMDNKDRDIIVMILWTSGDRCNLFDVGTLWHQRETLAYHEKRKLEPGPLWDGPVPGEADASFEDAVWPYSDDWFYIDEKTLNHNLRSIWTIDHLCRTLRIPIYHRQAYSLVNAITYTGVYHYEGQYTNLEIKMNQLERQHKLLQAVPKSRWYIDYRDWRNGFQIGKMMSMWINDGTNGEPKDGHPNQRGHEWIAKDFLSQPDAALQNQPTT